MIKHLRWLALPIVLTLAVSAYAFPGSGRKYPQGGSCTPQTVTFDAQASSATVSNSANTSITNNNLTIGSGSNRALVVPLVLSVQATSAVTCTWDGVSMTQIVSANTPLTTGKAMLFGLVNPNSGNKVLTCSWTTGSGAAISGVSYTAVDQTGGGTSFPNSTSNPVTQSGGSSTLTVTSSTNDAVMDSIINVNAVNTMGSPNQTNVYTNTGSFSAGGSGSSRAAGASSVNFTWALGSGSTGYVDVGTSIRRACL
jgi:hypothetical protein